MVQMTKMSQQTVGVVHTHTHTHTHTGSNLKKERRVVKNYSNCNGKEDFYLMSKKAY